MKNRFSLVDLRAIIASLQKELIGLRLANVYDLNQKTYIFKFAKPDLKVSLLIESGTYNYNLINNDRYPYAYNTIR